MTKKILKALLAVSGALFLLTAWSCSSTESMSLGDGAVNSAKVNEEENSCSSDDQCTTIKADCCGCNNGGTQKAVPSTMAKALSASMSEECAETMCIAMISQDPSCSQTAKCLNKVCVLQ